jgi:hypothetical protein
MCAFRVGGILVSFTQHMIWFECLLQNCIEIEFLL